MPSLAVETYEKLRIKIGEESARTIIEYIDSKVEDTTVTKLDLQKTENRLQTEIQNTRIEIQSVENKLRMEIQEIRTESRAAITDLHWQIKLYFIITSALIIFTNPKVLEIIGKIFKSVF